jgi:hypothetical protein
VETPNEKREVVHSQSVRDNSGISAGMIGVLVVVAIALITMLVLFWMSSQPTTDETAALPAQQQPTVIQQPARRRNNLRSSFNSRLRRHNLRQSL